MGNVFLLVSSSSSCAKYKSVMFGILLCLSFRFGVFSMFTQSSVRFCHHSPSAIMNRFTFIGFAFTLLQPQSLLQMPLIQQETLWTRGTTGRLWTLVCCQPSIPKGYTTTQPITTECPSCTDDLRDIRTRRLIAPARSASQSVVFAIVSHHSLFPVQLESGTLNMV